jgi:RNA polymerase sigma factor (sigma-70 family)
MNISVAHSSTETEDGLSEQRTTAEQDERIADAVRREQLRLRNFIRTRVADEDVDDILQEVFAEFVEALRLMKPIEQVGAWLFRVARNRIIDRFRTQRPESEPPMVGLDEGELPRWEDLLPSPDAGPDALYARHVLIEELDAALEELPEEQREVFLAHEVEGRSFKELAAATGISVNTLLSRKHAAVVYLRGRLHAIYAEFAKTWGSTR